MRERRLVWIDLEMTGLHPDEGDCIIEIATIVTEADLSIVAEGPVFAITPNDVSKLDNMDEWNTSCLLYTSPSPRDNTTSRMPSSA